MICLVVLIVFGILGIFSAKYRKIAVEAFHCVFRQATLRKCDSGMDIKIKSKTVAKIMKHSPKAARFVHKNFTVLSWIFTILFITSLVWTGVIAYNVVVYNNCYGPNADSSACILTNGQLFGNNNDNCQDINCPTGNCTECENCTCEDCNITK
jgi:hypothetical protein